MSDEIKSKDSYKAEEKRVIMERLDAQRRVRQEAEKQEKKGGKRLSVSEKEKILRRIDEERRIAQKYKELQRRRLRDKRVYHLENRLLYRFLDMNRAYYIRVEDCTRLSSRPLILPLFYQGFDGLKQKDVLIRIRDYSDKIFISDDVIRVYYKTYSLEDNTEKQ